MTMGRVFSGTRPASPLMGRGLILINEFGMSMRFFFKPGVGLGIAPSHPASIIYKIIFKIKLIYLFFYYF